MGSIITDGKSRSYGLRNNGKRNKSDAEQQRATQIENNTMWSGSNIKVEHSGVWGRYADGAQFASGGPGTFKDKVDYVKAAKNIGSVMKTYGSSRHPTNTYKEKSYVSHPDIGPPRYRKPSGKLMTYPESLELHDWNDRKLRE
jgi:hypothetical protein